MTLPTPVFIAGAAAFALAGFLAGTVTSSGDSESRTAKVQSYDPEKAELCLTGEAAADAAGAADDGSLCGRWQRVPGARVPKVGDDFRFVTVQTTGESGGEQQRASVIYGDVVK